MGITAKDILRNEGITCENCKYWHQDGRDLPHEGSCSALSESAEVSFYIPSDKTIENITTHANFGCALFEIRK